MKPSPELARLVAFAFQATGRRRLLEEDLVRLVSHERRWLPPSKTRGLVQAARAQGLLRAAGAHAYELGLEAEQIHLPLDYRPDEPALEAALAGVPATGTPVPLFRRLVTTISEATHESESVVVAAVNQLQQETGGLLRAEAAALLLGSLRGIDVSAFCDDVERELQRIPRPPGAK